MGLHLYLCVYIHIYMCVYMYIFLHLLFIASSLKIFTEVGRRQQQYLSKMSTLLKKETGDFLGTINIPSLKPISFLPSTFLETPRSLIHATHTILPIWLDFRPIWWPTSPWPVLLHISLIMAQRQWCIHKKHADPEASDPGPDAPKNKGNHYLIHL